MTISVINRNGYGISQRLWLLTPVLFRDTNEQMAGDQYKGISLRFNTELTVKYWQGFCKLRGSIFGFGLHYEYKDEAYTGLSIYDY